MSDIKIEVKHIPAEEDEAHYDAADWCYQVVDMGNLDEDGYPYIICLCSDSDEATQIAEALAPVFQYRTGVQVNKGDAS